MDWEDCACSATCSSGGLDPVQQRSRDQGDCGGEAACALRQGCGVRSLHRCRCGRCGPSTGPRSLWAGMAQHLGSPVGRSLVDLSVQDR